MGPKTSARNPHPTGDMPGGSGQPPEWSPATRVLFRFGLVYLTLFALATQVFGAMILIPGLRFRGLGSLWPMREITFGVANRVFGVPLPIDPTGANGETVFFGSQTFWTFLVAVALTVIWSATFPRTRDARIAPWFLLGIRIALAAQMFEYGLTKIIPNQFESPALTVLVTPVGDLSLNTALWTAIGSAPGYQMLTGGVELAGGVLLLWPGTVLLGTLVTLANLLHVFALNMAFDIGLKLTTLHLIVMAVVLLIPYFKRLRQVFFEGQAPEGSRSVPVAPAGGWARVLPLVFGAYLIGIQAWANANFWYAEGGGAPRSPLYGIWNVEELSVDGATGPPSLNDYDRRWRRVLFDDPDELIFLRTDDSFARYGARIDPADQRIVLSKGGSRNWTAEFRYTRDRQDRLVLDGVMDGLRIRVELDRVPMDTFRLLNSDFRWLRRD